MPDGRFLSRSIATSNQLASVSLLADYFFTRCIPHLDREGRVTGHPSALRGMVCPLRAEMTDDTVAECLAELHRAGLVVWYRHETGLLLEFPGFERHQRGLRKNREAPSRYPAPVEEDALGVELSSFWGTREQGRSNSGEAPEEVRASEVKGSEVKPSQEKGETYPTSAATESLAVRTERELREGLAPHPEAVVILDGWLKATGNRFALVSSIRKFGPGGIQECGSWADVASAMVDFAASGRGNLVKPNALGIFVATAKRNREQAPPSRHESTKSDPKPPVAPLVKANLDPSAASRRHRV